MVVHCGRGRLSGTAWSHLLSCWCDTATALSTISNVASGSLVLFSSNIVSVTLKILGNASFSFVTSVILKQFLMTIYFLAAFKYWDFWEPFQVPSMSGSLLRLLHFSGSLSNEKLGSTSTLPPFPTYSGSSSLVGDRIMYLFGNVKIILKQ